MTRVTLEDVAKKAGVHRTTVSLALRNSPSLPEATRQRLQELARSMGYRPDPALSALMAYRHQKAQTGPRPPLAYVTSWDTRLGWKRASAHLAFHTGASAKAAELGYDLEHFWLGEPKMTAQRMSSILETRGITGLILASHIKDNDSAVGLDWSRLSAITIDYFPREPRLHRVTNDQRAIIQLAFQRTLDAGYRRVGLVMPEWWDTFSTLAWSAGFLARQQSVPEEDRVPLLRYSEEESRPGVENTVGLVPLRLFQRWYEKHRPEVIISREEFVQPQLAALGLQVPRDVALVEMYLEPDGKTAGVRHNSEQVGALAIELLVGQIHHNICGIPQFPTCTLVEGTWFDGDSLPSRAGSRAATAVP